MTSANIINHPHTLFNNFLIAERMNQTQLLEEFTKLLDSIRDTRDKKIGDFVDAYRIAFDCTYKIGDCMLIRHFLLETVEEINNDLIKNNKPFRIGYSNKT